MRDARAGAQPAVDRQHHRTALSGQEADARCASAVQAQRVARPRHLRSVRHRRRAPKHHRLPRARRLPRSSRVVCLVSAEYAGSGSGRERMLRETPRAALLAFVACVGCCATAPVDPLPDRHRMLSFVASSAMRYSFYMNVLKRAGTRAPTVLALTRGARGVGRARADITRPDSTRRRRGAMRAA